ncbi:MAG TPA: PadR family transcriptional regulator [Gemmatimonadaceae bacterium]|nr:PadR family transcriptional regulator [Gemmatimonadaceae bacterium]
MLTDLSLHVLLAVGNGAAHGYAIGKDIAERSGGRLDPTTGALYQALKRLVDDALLRPTQAPAGESSDPRRKYFALTPAGRRAVAAEIARLEGLVALARERRLYPSSAG